MTSTGADPAIPTNPPLSGFTIGLTAARRREELATLLTRRGARVMEAPALRIVPLHDDEELLRATKACIEGPPEVVVGMTGIGFRGWMEAAEGWELSRPLLALLARATILTRGPKATGAVRAAGLEAAWSPASECSNELLAHLLASGVHGRTVALQLHGEPQPRFVDALRDAGARVIEVPVYRWVPHDDERPLERLIEAACVRQLDAVAFTSAPAVTILFRVAARVGRDGELAAAFRDGVLAACVGPVCAAPLDERGIPSVQPERGRLGALVRTIVRELPARRARTVTAAGFQLVICGRTAMIDGRPVTLPPAPAAVLQVLADRPGRVLSRAELLELAWHAKPNDEHAVEMAVARLRRALGPAAAALQTVVKRGYRLAVDDPAR